MTVVVCVLGNTSDIMQGQVYCDYVWGSIDLTT